ncbi:MAG: PCP reductase family protein, partial [Gemmatimonadetes bacterium]|nr:PCP reductase family protein [Gemmatimonadota bacterium]
DRIPSFVRGVVTRRVEAFARERGHARVTPELMDEVRRSLPVDFSRRRPFFLGGE